MRLPGKAPRRRVFSATLEGVATQPGSRRRADFVDVLPVQDTSVPLRKCADKSEPRAAPQGIWAPSGSAMNSTAIPQASATWRLFNLRLTPLEPETLLVDRAARELGLAAAQIRGLGIARKALDARRRNRESEPEFV